MSKTAKKDNITQKLKELEGIISWFDEQSDLDLQVAIEKAKEGSSLIKELRGSLKQVANELEEIKKGLEE